VFGPREQFKAYSLRDLKACVGRAGVRHFERKELDSVSE